MSKYTTGEMAKMCGVSVRTVQYYDSREILAPSELSEGGRRLYSEEDLRKLKIICFLRETGLPIDAIKQLLCEEHPEKVLDLLLKEQERVLDAEIAERQEQRRKLEELQSELKEISHFTVESIGDIAHIMENKKKLRHVHGIIVAVDIVMDIIEVATLCLWIQTGIWWPFVLGIFMVVLMAAWVMLFYYQNTVYICPQCHAVFRSRFWEFFFSAHTPKTRRLTCTACGHHGFCVETYGKEGEAQDGKRSEEKAGKATEKRGEE